MLEIYPELETAIYSSPLRPWSLLIAMIRFLSCEMFITGTILS